MTYRPQLYNILADVFVICQAAGILGILAKIYIRRYITYQYVRMINIVVYIQQRERERERERALFWAKINTDTHTCTDINNHV